LCLGAAQIWMENSIILIFLFSWISSNTCWDTALNYATYASKFFPLHWILSSTQ
jgi:hypothetical protein